MFVLNHNCLLCGDMRCRDTVPTLSPHGLFAVRAGNGKLVGVGGREESVGGSSVFVNFLGDLWR